jgi:hypothetical protein
MGQQYGSAAKWHIYTLALLWLAIIPPAFAVHQVRADGAEQGYTLLADSDAQSLDLALIDGTWQVWLGNGCDGIVPGLNVLFDRDAWTIELIDTRLGAEAGTCEVRRALRRDGIECATNPSGVCDVGWSR